MADILELAIAAFRTLRTSDRFYGIALTDGKMLMLEYWDDADERNVLIVFYDEGDRAKAEKLALHLATERYRNFTYACGVRVWVCGEDGKFEVDYEPSEADKAAYEQSSKLMNEVWEQQADLQRKQGLWRAKRE